MKKKLDCILFVDDDEATNFLHRHIATKANVAEKIITKDDGIEAIEYLSTAIDGKYPKPDLIFLDINMPVLDGWAFLKQYHKLPDEAKAKIVLLMLTTSENPEDRKRAATEPGVNGFKSKPLDLEMLQEIMEDYFPEYL